MYKEHSVIYVNAGTGYAYDSVIYVNAGTGYDSVIYVNAGYDFVIYVNAGTGYGGETCGARTAEALPLIHISDPTRPS